jgi:very-short-patch-repair endonuclease
MSARAALAGHAAALHEPRAPWGVSMFEVNQRLLALDGVPALGPRFAGARLRDLDGATVRSLRDDLVEWAKLSEPVRTRRSVWSGAVVESDQDAQEVLDLLSDLAAETVPIARARLDAVLTGTGLPAPGSVEEWRRPLALLEALAGTLAQVRPEVFDADLEGMVAALEPAGRSRWRRAAATMFDRDYRAARRAARELWVGQSAPGAVRLHAVVTAARDQARQWHAIGGQGAPRLPANLRDAAAGYGQLVAELAALSAYLVTDDLRQRPHGDLETEVAALLDDQQTLLRLPRIFELEERFARCHLQGFMQAVHDGRIAIDQMVDVFDLAWLSSIRAHVSAQDPRLANFDGALQDSYVEQFMTADRGHIDLTAQRVRRAVAEHATAVRDRHGDQNSVVAAQARRKRGHMPLRALFEQAPDVLTALRPCWTMSPLVVSQTLPATQVFDVVIFDEASQVQPADAVPALLRAPQAVVAGDRRQLPPTTFFDTTVDADDDPDGDGAGLTTGFESVLDVLDALLRSYRLTWHYRSQDERLIAFSNHAIYGGGLITFPGAQRGGSLRHEAVVHHPGRATDTRSNDDEVARVVDLMVSHARRRRHETLGVIAMGQYHADRIEHALRERITAERDPALDAFFDESAAERAFVKNLERVQGDERDAIILSVGYGRQPDGRLHHRFGPLNNDGGERRLNVAVTRARRRLTLVSSFSHRDMDPSRSTAEGVALLRRYLQYVESGGTDLGEAAAAPSLGPLDLDVKRHLEQAGLPVIAQHGSSGLRIDFALPHHTRTGRMALAVETDGAGYRDSPTTRDRDRLRQQVLERLGWRFHRIWSTDWCHDPQRETERVVSAYRHACDEIDLGWDDAAPVMTGRIEPEPPGPVARPRGPRPAIPPGLAITEYSLGELIQVARWIRSDTLLRTEEQMLAEMMRELGFKRRGSRIIGELRRAIARA